MMKERTVGLFLATLVFFAIFMPVTLAQQSDASQSSARHAILLAQQGTSASLSQGFDVLHSFEGYPTEGGAWPFTGLIQATNGNLYGTTNSGGAGGCTFGCGTVFEITPAGAFTMLYSFDVPNWGPSSGLVQATTGNLYGTTSGGGYSVICPFYSGCGTVFDVSTEGAMSTVYSFCSQSNCTDGIGPGAGVIQASDGNFYGSTYAGGASSNCNPGCGTVFKLTASGTLTSLYSFSGYDGIGPGVLLQASDGNFYGITLYGGTGTAYRLDGNGTIFRITPGGTLTTLYNFCVQTNCSDGGGPSGLIQASDGNFYGTTSYGGANGQGSVFELTDGGVFSTVYSFCSQKGCSDGSEPVGLMQASDGNLYGTTLHGGGQGTIFEITGGRLATIHKFGPNSGGYPDGANPTAGVMQASNGAFYGTTIYGGTSSNCSNGCGTVFTFGPPTAALSNLSLNLGGQVVDETSSAKIAAISNSGVAVLAISNVAITGNFGISANACTGATLTSGKACQVGVTFAPKMLGKQTGTLTFTDNAGNSPQTILLSGTGVEPATLSSASVFFGDQVVGTTSAPKIITLNNNQSVALTNIGISLTGDFSLSATTCTASLASKDKCTISVTFTPSQTGMRTGALSVSDSASTSPQTSTLTGRGTSD